MKKKYLIYLLGSTLLWLLSISILNYLIDPGALYRQKDQSVVDFVKALSDSQYGLWWPEGSFNEREIKKELIAHSTSDCALIGSSHIMQIGSRSQNALLQQTCKSILNLGVSGAGIEDHFIYTYLAMQNKHIKKIILGIDPWTFAYKKDMRYEILQRFYLLAKSRVLEGAVVDRTQKVSFLNQLASVYLQLRQYINKIQPNTLLNLINFEYTKRSLQTMRAFRENNQKKFSYINERPVDSRQGGKYPLLLPDGSLIYSAQYISDSRKNNKHISDTIYKTEGELNQREAILDYKKLVQWIKENHREPLFMMTPYHENSWKNKQGQNYKAFQETGEVISQLAHELHVKIIGTYQPVLARCSQTEFYDFMHPDLACVNKLSLAYQG